MRLNIDTPNIRGNELPTPLNNWFANITDQLNSIFGNMIADRVDVGNHGASPPNVLVAGMTADSIIVATIQSSTNPITIQTVTAIAGGFAIIFSGDPGLSCLVNYNVFVSPWVAQGVV